MQSIESKLRFRVDTYSHFNIHTVTCEENLFTKMFAPKILTGERLGKLKSSSRQESTQHAAHSSEMAEVVYIPAENRPRRSNHGQIVEGR